GSERQQLGDAGADVLGQVAERVGLADLHEHATDRAGSERADRVLGGAHAALRRAARASGERRDDRHDVPFAGGNLTPRTWRRKPVICGAATGLGTNGPRTRGPGDEAHGRNVASIPMTVGAMPTSTNDGSRHRPSGAAVRTPTRATISRRTARRRRRASRAVSRISGAIAAPDLSDRATARPRGSSTVPSRAR